MKQLSSTMTFFYKRVFPALWLGFTGLFAAMMVWIASSTGKVKETAPGMLIPVMMLAVGYFLFRKLLFNLADEVLDAGDALVVRNGGQEEKVPLSNVKNVNFQAYVNPPRITLMLRTPSRFGGEISFLPKVRFGEVFYGKNPTVEDLINRIDAARRR